MSYKDKALNERVRTLLSTIVALLVAGALIVGAGRWGEHAPLVEGSLMLVGCFLAAIGAFGRIWCSLYIAGYKNDTLVTGGPYSLCRNPLYLFSCIGGIGTGMTSECFTIPVLIALFFAIYYPGIIAREQVRLVGLFGEPYEEYIKKVPAFFPRWKTKIEQPESYTIKPRILTRSMRDALWFIWFIGVFEFVSALHDAGILPTLFRLP